MYKGELTRVISQRERVIILFYEEKKRCVRPIRRVISLSKKKPEYTHKKKS